MIPAQVDNRAESKETYVIKHRSSLYTIDTIGNHAFSNLKYIHIK